jgi:hypothetical protein
MRHIAAETTSGPSVRLASNVPVAHLDTDTLILPLPAVEFTLSQPLPTLGSRTSQLKVLAQAEDARSATLVVEGDAGTTTELEVRLNGPRVAPRAAGAILGPPRTDGIVPLTITFGPGIGYQQRTITLNW